MAEQSDNQPHGVEQAAGKTYYYYSQTLEVLGPVSEATLKELHKVGAVGDNPQICEKGTKAWRKFADVFPDLTPASKPATSPPTSGGSGPPPVSVGSAAQEGPRTSGSAGTPAAAKNRHLKPVLIGCGALAVLAMIGGVALMAMFAAAGSSAGGGPSHSEASSSAPSYGGGYQQQHAQFPCRRCGGGGQLMDRCTQCNGNGTIMTGVDSALDPDRTRSWNQNAPMQVPCPRCRGVGRMPIPCNHCRGTGVN